MTASSSLFQINNGQANVHWEGQLSVGAFATLTAATTGGLTGMLQVPTNQGAWTFDFNKTLSTARYSGAFGRGTANVLIATNGQLSGSAVLPVDGGTTYFTVNNLQATVMYEGAFLTGTANVRASTLTGFQGVFNVPTTVGPWSLVYDNGLRTANIALPVAGGICRFLYDDGRGEFSYQGSVGLDSTMTVQMAVIGGFSTTTQIALPIGAIAGLTLKSGGWSGSLQVPIGPGSYGTLLFNPNAVQVGALWQLPPSSIGAQLNYNPNTNRWSYFLNFNLMLSW